MVQLTDMTPELMIYPGNDYQRNHAKQIHNNISELHKAMINQNITGTATVSGATTAVEIPVSGLTQNDFYHLSIVKQTNAAFITAQSVPAAGEKIDVTFNVAPGSTTFSYIVKKGES